MILDFTLSLTTICDVDSMPVDNDVDGSINAMLPTLHIENDYNCLSCSSTLAKTETKHLVRLDHTYFSERTFTLTFHNT